jgi:hypothetical protein
MKNSLIEQIKIRTQKAVEAFKTTLNPPPFEAPKLKTTKVIVGWLIPERPEVTELDLDKLAIEKGQKTIQMGSETYKIEIFPGSLVIHLPEAKRIEAHHGESVQIGEERFRLSLLAARAFIKWFAYSIFFFIIPSLSYAQSPAAAPGAGPVVSPSAPPLPTGPSKFEFKSLDQKGITVATFDSKFEPILLLPGLNAVSNFRVSAALIHQNKELAMPVVQKFQEDGNYFIQVDTSGLCLLRKREEDINSEIRKFASTVTQNSTISLQTFYSANGKIFSATVFSFKKPQEVLDRSDFITCQPHTESVNVLRALESLVPLLEEATKRDTQVAKGKWVRRAVISFSSGNVGALSKAESILSAHDIDFYPILYTPLKTSVAEGIFTNLFSQRRGMPFWWTEPGLFHLADKFPYHWSLSINANVPYDLEQKTYPYVVRYQNEKYSYEVTSELSYGHDARAYFYYKLRAFVLATVLLALIVWTLYKIYSYYRIKICPRTRLPLSHTWNQSLFVARGRFPVLIVKNQGKYLSSYVVTQKVTIVSNGYTSQVPLNPFYPVAHRGFVIKKKGFETYEISPVEKSPFGLNGIKRQNPIHLRHGDSFNIGELTVDFLLPLDNEAKK